MQSSPSQLRNGEAVTEPSGHGAFAEAMRELIAELRPLRGLRLVPVAGDANSARSLLTKDAPGRSHLRLVR